MIYPIGTGGDKPDDSKHYNDFLRIYIRVGIHIGDSCYDSSSIFTIINHFIGIHLVVNERLQQSSNTKQKEQISNFQK